VSTVAAVEGSDFVALGQSGAYVGLETFPNPGVARVEMTGDELTALGPVNEQPDVYTVSIEYEPEGLCLESKSLKLYLGSYRNEIMFCESLAVKIRDDVAAALELDRAKVRVTLRQKSRGGIAIEATA
jgi:7-cyano-7-deazaguanine reductase